MMTKISIKTGAWGASLALLFFTGTVKGQIICGQPSQPIYYAADVLDNTVDIDVNGDGTPDFAIISTSSYTADIAPLGNNSIIGIPAPPPNPGYFAANVPAWTEISATTPTPPASIWYNNQTDQFGSAIIGAEAGMVGPPLGYFNGDTSGYAGFDLVDNGENYYGWIQLENPAPFVAGQVVDWAYESTPNTPIDAGEVPEPSTWALLLAGTAWTCRRSIFRRASSVKV